MVQDAESITKLGFFHEMCCHQHGDPLFGSQTPQVLPEISAGARIETGAGLVEQQQGGSVQQAFGNLHSAFEAAGQRFGAIPSSLGQPEAGQQFVDSGTQFAAGQTVQVALVLQVLIDRELRIEAWRLKRDPDQSADRRGVTLDILPEDRDCSALDGQESGHNAKECRLAAAVGPQEPEDLPVFQNQADVAQSAVITVVVREPLDGEGCGL